MKDYIPSLFDRSKLLQKKFRCIRYYQDSNDFNKHMEKTCVRHIDDNMRFSNEKRLYKSINNVAIIVNTIAMLI